MHMINLCESVKTDLMKNLRTFYLCFMHYNVWYNKNLCDTNLCDWRLTCIIRINKTCA